MNFHISKMVYWWVLMSARKNGPTRGRHSRARSFLRLFNTLPGACYAGYKRVKRNPGLYESVFNHLNFPFTRFKKKVRVDLFEAYEYSGRTSRWPLNFLLFLNFIYKKIQRACVKVYLYIHHDPPIVSVTVATRSICNHRNWLCCDGTHFKSKCPSL